MHPFTYATTATIFLALAGCGSGSTTDQGGSTAPTQPNQPTQPVQPTPPTLTLNATSQQTLAGGKTLTLTGATDSSSAPSWQLAAGSVGSLSAASGASVRYTPPAQVAVNTQVAVTAMVGGVSKSVALTVFPDPGAPGLSIISGRLNPDLLDGPDDGPLAAAHFRQSRATASDVAGNLYVVGTCLVTQTRQSGLTLRKIGIDGMVSTLASCESNNWFGAPDTAHNLQKFDSPLGIAVDHAGNIYIGNLVWPSFNDRVIYKISAQGVLSVLAGALGAHPAVMTDGSGANASFITPTIVGIDGNDNLYVLDNNDWYAADNNHTVVRQIDAAGNVSTIAALPTSLTADQDGNTYRVDSTSGAVIRTTSAGVDSTIANINTLPGILPDRTISVVNLTRTGPVTYALVVSDGNVFPNEAIVQLVVPH